MSTAPIELSSKESEITVGWQLTSNGGSVITGYRLYQTNVTDGGETLIYDGSNIPTVTSTKVKNLIAGHQYMYRVSGINRVGEGLMSPFSAVIMAASIPGRPLPPIFLSATSSTITLQITALTNNGGSAVTYYKLYADDSSQVGEVFTEIMSYDGHSLDSFTV